MLTGAAETEHWELDQLRIYPDGRRTSGCAAASTA